jgi:hypothetical protein
MAVHDPPRRMSFSSKLILFGGLQNLWQLGLVFPLNLLATAYFMLQARIRLRNSMDWLIVLYIAAGAVSFVTGVGLSFWDSPDRALLLNSLKSFAVFLGVLVYFGVRNINVDEFFRTMTWIVTLIGIAVLASYVYVFATDPISLGQSRSAISWLPGWPQRWVMFPIVGHFVLLCWYDSSRKARYLVGALILMAITLLSATRSAIVGVVAGHVLLSMLSKRDLARSLLVLGICGLVVAAFFDEFQEGLRLREVTEYDSSYSASSVEYRIQNVWPGIVRSLEIARLPFGWGHAGVAFIPHRYFPDTSAMMGEDGENQGSAEGEYMDVLVRQGFVGTALFVASLLLGMVYAYRLYRHDPDERRRALWKAALGWQFAIILHGVATETIRFPIYGLFFYLFLGILSQYRNGLAEDV